MNLKRTLFALTTLALAASVAQAAPGDVGAGSFNIGGTSASVSQTITVTVPKRFGLHLHRSSWNLDLGFLNANGTYTGVEGAPTGTSAGDAKCVRAGDHSSGATGTGRDFLYYVGNTQFFGTVNNASSKDRKVLSLLVNAQYEGDQIADAANNYSYAGTLTWPAVSNATSFNPGGISNLIGGYPGFYAPTSGGNTSLVWKGSIMCSFQTIVQKFSNSSSGFNFAANLTAASGGTVATGNSFPFPLYVRDFIKSGAGNPLPTGVSTPPTFGAVALTSTGGPQTLAIATSGNTSGGWLDDHLLQVLVFDGSETNGTYVGNVTYTLTDPTP